MDPEKNQGPNKLTPVGIWAVLECSKCNRKFKVFASRHDMKFVCPYCETRLMARKEGDRE